MITLEQARRLAGGRAYDSTGTVLGTVAAVYLDDATEQPQWVAVLGGGAPESADLGAVVVPLAGAVLVPGGVRVDTTALRAATAPRPDVERDELPPEDVDRLREHFLGTGEAPPEPRGVGEAEPGTLTRSEERVEVGVERRPVARARLRKVTVVDHVTVTVPVKREEVRVERLPPPEPSPGPLPAEGAGPEGEA